MTAEEVRQKIVGQRIVDVLPRGDRLQWQHDWLTGHRLDDDDEDAPMLPGVTLVLENGVRLRTLGEPLAVEGCDA